jgi:hypothetical protein
MEKYEALTIGIARNEKSAVVWKFNLGFESSPRQRQIPHSPFY